MADNQQAGQDGLWHAYLTALAQSVPNGAAGPQDVIAVGGLVPCLFDSPTEPVVLAQAYDVGDTVPEWTLSWNGAFNHQLFRSYSLWLQELSAVPLLGGADLVAARAQLTKLQQQQAQMVGGMANIDRQLYSAYLNDWCLEPDPDDPRLCKTLVPGAPAFADYKKDKLANDSVTRQAVEQINAAAGMTLLELYEQISALSLKIAGPGGAALTEAQRRAHYADPDTIISGDSADEKALQQQLQMVVKSNDALVPAPRFEASVDDYAGWVERQNQRAVQNNGPLFGPGADVQIRFDTSSAQQSGSSWKFSANLGFPVDFFWVGGGASGGGHEQYSESDDFSGLITYQAITTVEIGPGAWYDEGVVKGYADYEYSGKTAQWGPGGAQGIVVRGVIVGYAPYMKITFDHFDQTQTASHWSTHASFGIGPFNFESASASGSSYSNMVTKLDDGLEVRDTSGVPKIIGLLVSTPNWNAPVS